MTTTQGGPSSNLDLLRAGAVSCVFFSHLYEAIAQQHSFIAMKFGQLGVIMFFVHTSLVLMQSLERSGRRGNARISEFFTHRFFRIYPLSIFCVLVAFFLPGSNWSVGTLLANLTLTINLTYSESMVGGLWTLPLEVQMYLMLPFLYVFLKRRSAYLPIIVSLAVMPLAMIVPSVSGRLGVIEYIPCFFGGIIAWRLGAKNVLPGWLFVPAVTIATLPWVLSAGNFMPPRWATCTLIGLSIPLFCNITAQPVVAISQTIAKYSYGIYLSHPVALHIAFISCAGQPMSVKCLILIVLVVVFPLAAFHFIEAPMIRYGKRLTKTTPARLPAEMAPN